MEPGPRSAPDENPTNGLNPPTGSSMKNSPHLTGGKADEIRAFSAIMTVGAMVSAEEIAVALVL